MVVEEDAAEHVQEELNQALDLIEIDNLIYDDVITTEAAEVPEDAEVDEEEEDLVGIVVVD